MGVNYYAYAVIGCEVTGKLHDVVKVRQCDCPPAPEGSKFCPKCGASTSLRTQRVPKPFFDEDNDTLGSLTVSFTTDDQRAFAGLRSKIDSYGASQTRGAHCADVWPISHMQGFADVIRIELEKYGLWDPTTFGLWAVMRCSY